MLMGEPVAWMLVDASWNDFCRYSSYPSEGAWRPILKALRGKVNEK
jgi:hypothetical protein